MVGKHIIGLIKDEITMSQYFSVSVDSTPDITHTDHLTTCLRYVYMMNHQPVERFLTFINISSHTEQNLANTASILVRSGRQLRKLPWSDI